MKAYIFAAAVITTVPLSAGWATVPVTFVEEVVTYTVEPNGGYTKDFTLVRRAATDAAAKQVGQYFFEYTPALEKIKAIDAETIKPDGRVIKVARDMIRDQTPPGDPMKEIFTDAHQKAVIYPNVSAGDLLRFHVREFVAKPKIPGGFQDAGWVSPEVGHDKLEFRYDLPKTMHLRVEQSGFRVTVDDKNNREITTLRAGPLPGHWPDIADLGPFSRRPHYFVSTFPSHAVFAAAYTKLALPHARVTPAIQAKANAITNGISDRRAQAVALYDWVSDHIRYVASYIGDGPIEPHDADEVLTNGYGDCKDHVVLLHALLAAKSIKSEMALINLGNEAAIGKPPTILPFNHVITYIPEFHTFVDSTLGVAPFGVLLSVEQGKPVVMVGGSGPAVRRTPVEPETRNSSQVDVEETISMAGTLYGHSTTTATGWLNATLRLAGKKYELAGPQALVNREIAQSGEDGTGMAFLNGLSDISIPYRPQFSFSFIIASSDLPGASFRPAAGPGLLLAPGGKLFLGLYRHDLPASEAMLCFPGRQSETISVALPPGFTVDRLPDDLSIEHPEFNYTSHWALTEGILKVQRVMTSKVAGPVCRGDVRRGIAEAAPRIWADQERRVTLRREKH